MEERGVYFVLFLGMYVGYALKEQTIRSHQSCVVLPTISVYSNVPTLLSMVAYVRLTVVRTEGGRT